MGCGEERQCIWLPYPHHIDPWCAGVDFLNDIDYRSMRTLTPSPRTRRPAGVLFAPHLLLARCQPPA